MDKDTEIRLFKIFENVHNNANSILNENSDVMHAADLITHSIASDLNMRLDALLSDICATLSKETLRLKIFDNSKNQNIFFDANIERNIFKKYHFDIDSADVLKKGIQINNLNKSYLSASAAVGTATVGWLLTSALSDSIALPLIVALVGAIAAFCASYFKVAPSMNRQRFQVALAHFLKELQTEIERWVSSVEEYYHSRVQEIINNIEK